jgi:hypothetical protein
MPKRIRIQVELFFLRLFAGADCVFVFIIHIVPRAAVAVFTIVTDRIEAISPATYVKSE